MTQIQSLLSQLNLQELPLSVYDIGAFVVLFLFFVINYYRGFLSAFIGLVKTVVAVIVGLLLSNRFSEQLYSILLEKRLVMYVYRELSSVAEGLKQSFSNNFIGSHISSFLETNPIGSDLQKASQLVVDSTMKDLIVSTFHIFIFAIGFLICLYIFNGIQNLFKKTNQVPVLGSMNRFGGGLLGLTIGIAFLYFVSAVLCLIIHIWNPSFLQETSIIHSHFFGKIYILNPFYN